MPAAPIDSDLAPLPEPVRVRTPGERVVDAREPAAFMCGCTAGYGRPRRSKADLTLSSIVDLRRLFYMSSLMFLIPVTRSIVARRGLMQVAAGWGLVDAAGEEMTRARR